MELSRIVVGQVGTLNLEAVQERATRSPCTGTVMRLALAEAGVEFRVAEVRPDCSPPLLIEIVEPVPPEHQKVLRRVKSPSKLWVGDILFKPKPPQEEEAV